MIEKLIDAPELYPALILTSGVVKTTPSTPEDSYPEGTCFFLDVSYVATARHCGEILRDSLQREGVRGQGGKQGYGQAVYDPRRDLAFKVIEELPLSEADISVLRVCPMLNAEDDATHYLPFCEAWADREKGDYPTLRRAAVEDGEELRFSGFTDIRFSNLGLGSGGTLSEKVEAKGIVGSGRARWCDREGASGVKRLLHIEGVTARGQNSGGPVFDKQGRIVGVISRSPEGDVEPYTVAATFPFAEDPYTGRVWTRLDLKSTDDQKQIAVWTE